MPLLFQSNHEDGSITAILAMEFKSTLATFLQNQGRYHSRTSTGHQMNHPPGQWGPMQMSKLMCRRPPQARHQQCFRTTTTTPTTKRTTSTLACHQQ